MPVKVAIKSDQRIAPVTPLNKQKYKQMIKNALKGSLADQLMLARCYAEGLHNIPKDFAKAAKYLEMAAKNQNAPIEERASAFQAAGRLYYFKLGDKKKAFEFFKEFHKLQPNRAEAQYLLAICYLDNLATEKRQPEKAVELFKSAAALGDAASYAMLASCYQNGDGIGKDIPKAFDCHLKAAHAGIVSAQFNVAQFYYHGIGTNRDLAQAISWYEKAAAKGHTNSQKTLNFIYSNGGEGLEKNLAKAFEWIKRAADDAEDSEACYMLGEYYLLGKVGVKDSTENISLAIQYFETAIKKGNLKACVSLGWFYAKDLKAKKQQKLGFDLIQKAALKKEPSTFAMLSLCYSNGFGVAVDKNKAIDALNQAKELNEPQGITALGVCYLNGDMVTQNREYAVTLFKLAEKTYSGARIYLGVCYYEGWGGLERDYKKAFELFSRPENVGNDIATYYLALCHLSGHGTVVDTKKGIELLEILDKKGNADASTMLGMCYMKGKDVEQNPIKAAHCFLKASNKNNPAILNCLAVCYLLGYGIEKNLPLAIELFKKVENHKSDALNNLGWHTLSLGPSSYPTAVEYFKEAIKKGNLIAENNLGWCMLNGFGMVANKKNAGEYFNILNARRATQSKLHEGFGISVASGLVTSMNLDIKLFFSHALSDEALLEQQRNLAFCYTYGFGVEKNLLFAADLFKKSEVLDKTLKEKAEALAVARSVMNNIVNKVLSIPTKNNSSEPLKPPRITIPTDNTVVTDIEVITPSPNGPDVPENHKHEPSKSQNEVILKEKTEKLKACETEMLVAEKNLRKKRFYGLALTHYNSIIEKAHSIGAKVVEAQCYAGLSECYHGLAVLKKSNYEYDACLDMYKKAIENCKIAEELLTTLNGDATESSRMLINKYRQLYQILEKQLTFETQAFLSKKQEFASAAVVVAAAQSDYSTDSRTQLNQYKQEKQLVQSQQDKQLNQYIVNYPGFSTNIVDNFIKNVSIAMQTNNINNAISGYLELVKYLVMHANIKTQSFTNPIEQLPHGSNLYADAIKYFDTLMQIVEILPNNNYRIGVLNEAYNIHVYISKSLRYSVELIHQQCMQTQPNNNNRTEVELQNIYLSTKIFLLNLADKVSASYGKFAKQLISTSQSARPS